MKRYIPWKEKEITCAWLINNGSRLMVKGSSTSEATKSMTWLMVAIIGCGISITIEALQFCFMKGFSEVDDVMHNTVGCLIGYMLVKGSCDLWNKRHSSKQG